MPTTSNIQFGQPCWDHRNVRKVISLEAHTSEASAGRFLAAHSPFQKIIDGKTDSLIVTEEEVYQELFVDYKEQVQAFVKGPPGTGKSHLIRWLKERSDYASRFEEGYSDRRRVVLVTRGNGSLKNALGQIARQLGNEFSKYIDKVQGAVDRLSAHTALATLLAELALEIDTRWTNQHARDPLPSSLAHLGDALRSTGFGEWMKRDNGVIHLVVQRLTESSTAQERGTFPKFTSQDFVVPEGKVTSQNASLDVIYFAEDLKEDPKIRELAAEVLNTALQDAIRSMTGLRGSDLIEIFTEIRRKLGPRRELFVLIEDVTVMQLNLDVINAFEIKEEDNINGKKDLCRMVAVLGIADSGWNDLPVNQSGRPSHIYEVGGQTESQWVGNRDEISKFTARYLNAIRSNDEEIHAIAEERFTNDVNKSACDACCIREECHNAFGKVVFDGGAEVGLFPFTKDAPHTLLLNLKDSMYKSQRGLLDRVLLNALDRSYTHLQSSQFPQAAMFPVNVSSSAMWAGFENRYCGGAEWDSGKKSRLKFFSQFWVECGNADELARNLEPFLKPLGFPNFSISAKKGLVGGAGQAKSVVSPIPQPPPPPEDQELINLLSLLDNWIEGQPLRQDNKFRELLSKFLKYCIVWEDIRDIPITELKRLIFSDDNRGGSRVPFINGQTMNPSSQLRIIFDRNKETRDLIQGLLMLARASGNWNFIDSEIHKRSISMYIRNHKARFIKSIQPETPSLVQEGLRSAIQALALTYLLRERKKLPEGRPDRVAAIFTPSWDHSTKPIVLSKELGEIVEDLAIKNSDLREFLLNELGVGQGDSNPSDFINPVPILKILSEFEKEVKFDPPSSKVSESFWAPRFKSVKNFSNSFNSFIPSFEKEKLALGEAVAFIKKFVDESGFSTENLRLGMESCLCELSALIELQQGVPRRDGVFPIDISEGFRDLWQKKYLQDSDRRNSWGSSVTRALDLSTGEKLYDLTTFSVNKLKECIDIMRNIEMHIELVDREMTIEERQVGPDGDSRSQFLDGLDEISALLDNGENTGGDVE
jgi:hypothetical protein